MKRIIKLTERDLTRIVRRVINERQYLNEEVVGDYFNTMNSTFSSQIAAYMDAKIANLMASADKNNNPDGVNNLEIN